MSSTVLNSWISVSSPRSAFSVAELSTIGSSSVTGVSSSTSSVSSSNTTLSPSSSLPARKRLIKKTTAQSSAIIKRTIKRINNKSPFKKSPFIPTENAANPVKEFTSNTLEPLEDSIVLSDTLIVSFSLFSV